MAAGTVAYTDTRGNKDYLGMIASQIGKRVKQASNMAAEERAFAAKRAEEQGTSLEEAGIGKGYFFKRALGSRFGGDKIARTRGRLGAEGPGKDPTKNYKQRFRGGFDYNVTNEIQSATVPLSSALVGGLRGVENGLDNISQALATMGSGMSDLARGQNDLAKATYFNGMVLRVMVTEIKRQQSRIAGRREERSLESGRPRLSGGGDSIKGLLPGSGGSGGGFKSGSDIGDIARGAGQFLTNRSAYKTAGSAYKGGSSAMKSLRAGGGAITKIPEVTTAIVKNVDKVSTPLEVANTTKKLVRASATLVGNADVGAKIMNSFDKSIFGPGNKSSLTKRLGPGAAGLGQIVEIAAEVDPKNAKALAATRGALPPGAGLASLGDDGLGMITNSPDVVKALNTADAATDGAATAKTIATASDAGATKAGLLAFLKTRKPKGLVRGSAFTRMMVRNPAGKMFLKKLPLIGAIAGGIFAVQRLMEGDFLGAGLELGSGILGATGLAPASLALDGLLLARDFGAVPFAKGGVLTGKQPVNALMGEAGPEIVTPLNDETFIKFGQGFIDAQKRNRTDAAKIQAEGLKQYYEGMGGWNKFGKSFEGIFDNLKNIINSIRLPSFELPSLFPPGPGGPPRPGATAGSDTLDIGGGGGQMNLSDEQYKWLAYAISGEAGPGDDQYAVAASILNRVAEGRGTVEQVVKAHGQYEAYEKGMMKMSPEIEARLKSPEGQARLVAALNRLQGRTDFKGQTQLQNRVAAEDPMVDKKGNFFHYSWQTGPNSQMPANYQMPNYQQFIKRGNVSGTTPAAPPVAQVDYMKKWAQSLGTADQNATALNTASSNLSMLSGLNLSTPTIINNTNYYTQSGSGGGEDGNSLGSPFDMLSAFNAQYSLATK
tara:strand:+ start:824 stop:3484 length:2661 start_codon:yes stop_codon:yes gene_type:complete